MGELRHEHLPECRGRCIGDWLITTPTTDPAENLLAFLRPMIQADAADPVAYEEAVRGTVHDALAAAYQRGQSEAVERIRAALDRNEGYGHSGHLTRSAIDAILDAQADR